MNIKKVKEIVNWMYSKDNPNHQYNRKNNPSYIEMFEKGRDQFNQEEIYQAHVTWEHIWKEGD